MVVYIKKNDHCTRCHKPFNSRLMFMVRECVAWKTFSNEFAVTNTEIVPVCGGGATTAESAQATRQATCKGCNAPMLTPPSWQKDICSSRCEQRAHRARRRTPSRPCAVCKIEFVPKRSDAKFCSGACRQWAYRLRHSGGKRAADYPAPVHVEPMRLDVGCAA